MDKELTTTDLTMLTLMRHLEAGDWTAAMAAVRLLPGDVLEGLIDVAADALDGNGAFADCLTPATARHIIRLARDEQEIRQRRMRVGGGDAARIAAIKGELQRLAKTGRAYEADLMAMRLTDGDIDAVLKRFELFKTNAAQDTFDLLKNEQAYRAGATDGGTP